ncbi:protein-tyrosine-phosphatase [Camelimonas fluminis]|uniref:Tyrosine specific protein phosphatases domain-containing protein n=1 Tax=Camelimonas fluminis TaxID=1576911 RepID=A0ABV7UF30_9HYPH|nr:hypothetical protein [Camelimonas fluminis]GHE73014.1 protein-tyrosine-phosphatase [Camelimonas fluminis]
MVWLPDIQISDLRSASSSETKFGATAILSIVDPDTALPCFRASRRWTLTFHDVDDSFDNLPGIIAPSEHHIRAIITYARSLAASDRMLIHCHAGISRSPAAALIALAGITRCAATAMSALHRIVPADCIEPNSRMLQLADTLLGMEGALTAFSPQDHGQSGPFCW